VKAFLITTLLFVGYLAAVPSGQALAAPSSRASSSSTTSFVSPRCDRKPDDTRMLQRAINAAAAANAVVLLPSDTTCVVTSTLHLPSNTYITGGGFGSVLKFSSGGPFLSTSSTGESNITLADFTATGDGSGLPSGLGHDNSPGVVLNSATHITINGLQVSYDTGVGISLLSDQDVLVENSSVNHSGRDGITSFETGSQQVENETITRNTIADVGDDGIAVDLPQKSSVPVCHCLATNITITDNVIEGWPKNPNGLQLGRGIALNGVGGPDANTVAGNFIANTYSAGLMLSGCTLDWCGSTTTLPDTQITAADNWIVNAGQDYKGSIEGQENQPAYGIYLFNLKSPVNITGNAVANAYRGKVKIG
jgi:hypothetical protein